MINIIGLAIGMATAILIALYVQYEFSFDRYHENALCIYRIAEIQPDDASQGGRRLAVTPGPLAPALMQEFPEVVSATRIVDRSSVLLTYQDKRFLENRLVFADQEIFEIFSFELIKGNPTTALDDVYSIIVSESMAEKYFGSEDPIGKVVRYENLCDFMVTGVMRDVPLNSHFVMDFIVPLKTSGIVTTWNLDHWDNHFVYTYVNLNVGANPSEFEDKLGAVWDKYFYEGRMIEDKDKYRFFIQPLSRIHLHSDLLYELTDNNSIGNLYILSSIGFLILIIACINTMNLSTARAANRCREVGIRKVAGAQKEQLIGQFLGESIIIAFFALLFSVGVALLTLPGFNSLIQREISFHLVSHFPAIMIMIAFALIVGLFAGCYPAFFVSAYKPISVLRGSTKKRPKGIRLRSILVVFQFSISTILIICTLIIREQLSFVRDIYMGFNKDQIVAIRIRDGDARKKIGAIKYELQKHPNILWVSSSSFLPNPVGNSSGVWWEGKPDQLEARIFNNWVDYDFVDLFDIQIVEGRNFSLDFVTDANGAYLINETAAKMIGLDSPLGIHFQHGAGRDEGGKVVGVMKDFHLHSLHRQIEPLCFYLDPERDVSNYTTTNYLSIKISPYRIHETLDFLKNRMEVYSPEFPFEYRFFDEIFDQAYRAEQRLGSITQTFAFVAIAIACLGLFSLSALTSKQRTKEIAVRKVMGSTVLEIVILLLKSFLKWVLIANVIAWPAAYFIMCHWLREFAYRINWDVGVFFVSLSAAFGIALATVASQCMKAARTNPVDCLRFE